MTASSVVIVGSGIGGHALARELRKLDPHVSITIVSADSGDIYAKPTLSIALAQGKVPEAIPIVDATKFALQQHVTMRTGVVVRTIDLAARRLDTDAGPISWDRLVLAVGARQTPLPGIEESERVLSVNHLDDYRRFRTAVDGHRRVLIAGAGFIGCEFANDLRHAQFDVDVVDIAPHPLARFWPAELARIFEARMAQAGVRWHLGTRISKCSIDDDGVIAKLSDGTTVQADLVLSALGLVPSTSLARTAGLQVGRGVSVDTQLRTSVPDVYALGDCAEIDGTVWPFVMPTLHCARALARTLTGTPTPVVFPPMPVSLKTPACPAVFLPAMPGASGTWEFDGHESAVMRSASAAPLAVALLGSAVSQRDAWVKQLTASQAAANQGLPKSRESSDV